MRDMVLGTVLALPFLVALSTALAGKEGAPQIFVGVAALLAPGVAIYVMVGGIFGTIGGIALTGAVGYWFWRGVLKE